MKKHLYTLIFCLIAIFSFTQLKSQTGFCFSDANSHSFTAGSGAQYLLKGDFNGDLINDLISLNSTDNNMSVFLGNNTMSLSLFQNFPAGSNPSSGDVADFNADGKLDVIVVNTSVVSVLLGNGNGTFGSPTGWSTSTNPASVTCGDFNGDLKIDIAVANSFSTTVSIRLGNGDGTFGSVTNIAAGSNPHFIESADFNSDGNLDIVIANYGSANISVFLGNGNGTFGARTNFSTGTNPQSITIGDFSLDGKLDIAVCNFGSTSISVLIGNGIGGFAASVSYPTIIQPDDITCSDLNLDGFLDLIFSTSGTTNVAVLMGTGTGTFSTVVRYHDGINAANAVVCNDFNADGFIDVAITSGTNLVTILENNGNGTLNAWGYGTQINAQSICAADFNMDGKNDIATANGSSGTFSVLLNNGNGTFAGATSFSLGGGTNPCDIKVGDFDSDGKLDIVVVLSSANYISLWHGVGNGTFTFMNSYPTGANPKTIKVEDFNGDGKQDVVYTNRSATSVSIRLGSGTGTLGAATNFTVGSVPYCVDAKDFNSDGKLDLCVSNYNSNNISILMGTGTGSFLPMVNYLVGTNPNEVIPADLNGDNKPDLISFNIGSSNYSVLLNSGTGTFLPATFSPTAGIANLADIDYDGKLDLVIGSSNTIKLFTGVGNGTFIYSQSYNVGNPSGIIVTSLDANSSKDIAVINGTNCVATFLNKTPLISASASTNTVCAGSSVTLSATGGTTYTWSHGVIDGVPFVPTTTTTYTVTGTTLGSCSNSSTVTVTVNPTVTASASSDTICLGEPVVLNGSGADSYSWSGGVLNGVPFFPLITSTYTVTGIDSTSGCFNTDSIILTVNSLPNVVASTSATTICAGSAATLTGNGASSYTWSSGVSNGNAFVPIATSTYTVTGTDTFGCTNTDTITITLTPGPLVYANASVNNICLGDSVELFGTGAVSYTWSGGVSNGVSFYPSVSMTYYLTGADSNGCTSIDSINLIVNPLPAFPSITQIDSALISTAATGYDWFLNNTSVASNAQYFVPFQNGTYSVTITDVNGCSSSSAPFAFKFVWPGDTNNDSIVDNTDLLPLGIFYGSSGPNRSTHSNLWLAFASENWNLTQLNAEDLKHVDCNGDGTMNFNDTLAINMNFNSIHTIGLPSVEDRASVPPIYFSSSATTYTAGDWVEIDVMCGDFSNPAIDVYGLAFDINYDASLVESSTEELFYPTTWLSTPGINGVTFSHIEPVLNTAFGATTRINHSGVDGFGRIATFRFQVKNSLSTPTPLNFSFSGYLANDSVGNDLLFNPINYSVMLNPVSTGLQFFDSFNQFNVFPNPSTDSYNIVYSTDKPSTIILELYNILGEKIDHVTWEEATIGSFSKVFSWKPENKSGSYFLKLIINGEEKSKLIVHSK